MEGGGPAGPRAPTQLDAAGRDLSQTSPSPPTSLTPQHRGVTVTRGSQLMRHPPKEGRVPWHRA